MEDVGGAQDSESSGWFPKQVTCFLEFIRIEKISTRT